MIDLNKIFNFYYGWWKNIDKFILFLILFLFSLGLFFSLVSTSIIASDKLNTNTYYFFIKHLFFIILGISSVLILFLTNPLTIKISIFFSILIMLYPLTKRFLPAPQFILGITFGSGTIIAYSLQSNIFSFPLAVLYLGVIAWIVSFDTYYALEDKEDDLKIGINSTAILWGDNAIKYSQILHLYFYSSLLLIAIVNQFSYIFFLNFIILIALFLYQRKLIKNKQYMGGFKINNWVGIVALIGFTFEIIYLN